MSAWPSQLEPLIAGFVHALGDNVIRTQMEVGKSKQRRRAQVAPDTLQFSIQCSAAQWQTLVTFYKDTIGEAGEFTINDPSTAETYNVRFTSPPAREALTHDLFRVPIELEIV